MVITTQLRLHREKIVLFIFIAIFLLIRLWGHNITYDESSRLFAGIELAQNQNYSLQIYDLSTHSFIKLPLASAWPIAESWLLGGLSLLLSPLSSFLVLDVCFSILFIYLWHELLTQHIRNLYIRLILLTVIAANPFLHPNSCAPEQKCIKLG
jgi:uncharacterized membrane protein YjdF